MSHKGGVTTRDQGVHTNIVRGIKGIGRYRVRGEQGNTLGRGWKEQQKKKGGKRAKTLKKKRCI